MTVARFKRKTKSESRPCRFDEAALLQAAGEKVFARGQDYHASGQVEIIAIEKRRVLAKVVGSEVYSVELKGAGADISGACSCPAFSDWGFCKHLVATALAVNSVSPQEVLSGNNRLARIREHLRAKGTDALVDLVMRLAEDEPALLRELELAAAMEDADDEAVFAQLKKAITDATRTRGYVDYRAAGTWAKGIETVLDRVESLIGCGRAELAVRLTEHVFARMDEALNSMDDSDGNGGGVYARACEIHLAACRVAKPEPIALAHALYARETLSDWDFFHAASETYAEALGKKGLAEYRRLAEADWAKIKPARSGARRGDDEDSYSRHRLGGILERFAERDGDVDRQIAIRAKCLSSAYAYLGIAQLCLDRGRRDEALKWAEEGLWQFEDDPDERLIVFTADLHHQMKRGEDAQKLLWQAFERSPSFVLYEQIKAATKRKSDSAVSLCARAINLLRERLRATSRNPPRWDHPADLLVEVLMCERRFADAWKIAREWKLSAGLVENLAKASSRDFPQEAVAAYAARVEQLIGFVNQSSYDDAARLIREMRKISEHANDSAAHLTYVCDLMRRHKAKRNLVKLLRSEGYEPA